MAEWFLWLTKYFCLRCIKLNSWFSLNNLFFLLNCFRFFLGKINTFVFDTIYLLYLGYRYLRFLWAFLYIYCLLQLLIKKLDLLVQTIYVPIFYIFESLQSFWNTAHFLKCVTKCKISMYVIWIFLNRLS